MGALLCWALVGLSACEEPGGLTPVVRPHLEVGPVVQGSPVAASPGAVASGGPQGDADASGAVFPGVVASDRPASVASVAPSTNPSPSPSPTPSPSPAILAMGPGIPVAGPWAVIHGSAAEQPSLDALAERYRLLVVDADPELKQFTSDEIATLQAGGRNKVLSYLNVGSIEIGRSYWSRVPSDLTPAQNLRSLGSYGGYPRERWMDFSDEGWRKLVVEHIAWQLKAQGVDGFFLDNMELLEHPAVSNNGPCSAACREGGLRLVAELRAAFPDAIIVNQGAIASSTREAQVDGHPFPAYLDGVTREAVFTAVAPNAPAATAQYFGSTSKESLANLQAWHALSLRPGGHPFWVGVLEYTNVCMGSGTGLAKLAGDAARAEGFAPALGDRSSGLRTPCNWPDEYLAPPP